MYSKNIRESRTVLNYWYFDSIVGTIYWKIVSMKNIMKSKIVKNIWFGCGEEN